MFCNFEKSQFLQPKNAFSVLELLLATGIVAVMVGILGRDIALMSKWHADFESDIDVMEMQNYLAGKVDCMATLAPYRSPTTGEVNLAVDSIIDLLNRKSELIGGNKGPLSSAFSKARWLRGNWYGEFRWNGSSISVYAGKKESNSWNFATKKMNGTVIDFASAPNPIFGMPPDRVAFCANRTTPRENFVSEVIDTQIQYTNPLIGRGPTDEATSLLIRYPFGVTNMCHQYCKQRGFKSGWLTQLSDVYGVYDVNGYWIRNEPYDPGESHIQCQCVL